MSTYEYVASNPQSYLDPSGEYKRMVPNWDDCTLTLQVHVKFDFRKKKKYWSEDEMRGWVRAFVGNAEDSWNLETVTIPDTSDPDVCCRCERWTPRLDIIVGKDDFGSYDWYVHVTSDEEVPAANAERPHAAGSSHIHIHEMQVNSFISESGNWHSAPAHEVGHLLGNDHPGAQGAPDEYSADPTGVMGQGMELRPEYFTLWEDYLETHSHCATHKFEGVD